MTNIDYKRVLFLLSSMAFLTALYPNVKSSVTFLNTNKDFIINHHFRPKLWDLVAWEMVNVSHELAIYRSHKTEFIATSSNKPIFRKLIGNKATQANLIISIEQSPQELIPSPPKWKVYEPQLDFKQDSALTNNMVYVQGGTFRMGDNFGDGEYDENPVHKVELKNFYISKYEVTVAEFAEFVKESNYETSAERGDGSYIWKEGQVRKKKKDINWRFNAAGKRLFKSEYNHPVVHVSWDDAIAYCNWRSEKEGLSPVYLIDGYSVKINEAANGYRLPTEAEWEFAARKNGARMKWAGTSKVEYLGIYANGIETADGYKYSAPVGTFRSNGLGLFDMSGNVWEWCWDWRGSYSSELHDAPKGPSYGAYKVLRGGSWDYEAIYLRCSYRRGNTPSYRDVDIGFRICQDAP